MRNNKSTIGAVVAAGTTFTMVTLSGIAYADPVPATPERAIAIVGSETTTPVMNALANDADALALGGVRQVASFNASGSAQINTHPSLGGGTLCNITRPNGSTDGRNGLLLSASANRGAGDGCILGALSSSAGG
ncbi:MAG: hypothetical protein ACT4PP_16890, partial [Sporichthyaceae bacterium]